MNRKIKSEIIEECDYDKQRAANIEERLNLMKSVFSDIEDIKKKLNVSSPNNLCMPIRKRTSSSFRGGDRAWFKAKVSLSRSSPPRTRSLTGSSMSEIDDSSIPCNPLIVKFPFNQKQVSYDDDETFLDETDYAIVKKSRRGAPRSHHFATRERTILPVESVTARHLALVSYTVSSKVYDPSKGSSCHQCRQKTQDTKTVCRSEECFGVRGQFCGVCLKNRYGEDAREALKDPNWACPVCRGICNCSFCRPRQGKACTGILVHHAKSMGYGSVKDYLADNEK